jgi:hypothetical protein
MILFIKPLALIFRKYPFIKHPKMKTLKLGITALLLTFAIGSFASSTSDMGKRKKKHKCNTECTNEKHNYKHGEKKHTCGDACKKMMEGKM